MKMTVTTGYAPSADPRRGYHNYNMKVVFEVSPDGAGTTEEGQKAYMVMLHDHLMKQKYMWCYPPKKITTSTDWREPAEWVINYGYDSGD